MALTDPKIFEQARTIESSAERLSFLKEACEDDLQLQRLVKLLDVGIDDSFLEKGTADFEGLYTTLDRSGEVIDSYRLLEKIAHGGMGVVYRAEQFEPIKRIVAIKLIRVDTSVDKVVPRFKSERQALALMEHPNVARFYDAGTTSRGNPYFVMEYVDGLTLTKYCDTNRLTISERLELFRKICNAVIHANQKGIVHRDLKPGNIIVKQIDGQAVPKVIDFGLAKSQDAQWNHETVQSDFGQFLGTLAYMSPEQASNSSDEIDARSDVYSLGIILYELLVGSPPFTPKQFKDAALDEVISIAPDSFDTMIERANAYQLLSPSNLVLAEKDLKAALSIREDDPEAKRLLKNLHLRLPVMSNDGQCVTFYRKFKNIVALPDGSSSREIDLRPGHKGPKQLVDPKSERFLVRLSENRESPNMISSSDGISVSSDESFIVYQDRSDEIFDLIIMNIDGSNRRVLVEKRWVYTPVISPDNTRVAFMIHDQGDIEIAMINVDGTGFRILTRTKGRDGGLTQGAWDRDGKRLTFMSERKGKPRRVYVLDVTTMATVELGIGSEPFWSEVDQLGNFKPRRGLMVYPYKPAK